MTTAMRAGHPDTLIAASAREQGGVFAPADERCWKDEVHAVLNVAAYARDRQRADRGRRTKARGHPDTT